MPVILGFERERLFGSCIYSKILPLMALMVILLYYGFCMLVFGLDRTVLSMLQNPTDVSVYQMRKRICID